MACLTQEPSVGSGVATVQLVSSRSTDDGYESYDYETYSLSATPDAGWEFTRWERDIRSRSVYPSGPRDWSGWRGYLTYSYDNPRTCEVWSSCRTTDPDSFYYGEGLDREYHIRAVFTLCRYLVSVRSANALRGAVSGTGYYNHGETCTMVATATAGYVFKKWTCSDGRTADTATHTFTVTGDVTWTAHFGYASTGELLCNPTTGALLCGKTGAPIYL